MDKNKETSDSKLLVSYKPLSNNQKIGVVTLNKPKALNALDLDMIGMFLAQLETWRHDESVQAIFVDSACEKAFCAGGDIVSIYKAMDALGGDAINNAQVGEATVEFFAQEYRLDYCLHSYPKPVITWGHGIIMGGGLGVFAGGHIKIVTETSRVAMPEITIGLFPDVGASYFLNKMPKGMGKFLGLTASSMNAKDCLTANLADYFIPNHNKSNFLNELTKQSNLSKESINAFCKNWCDNINVKKETVDLVANLQPFYECLGKFDELDSLSQIHAYLKDLSESFPSNTFIKKAMSGFENGSTTTAHLVQEQLKRGKHLSLADCFKMELNMAYGCIVSGEFKEGIRALLIDKDNAPNWQYKNYEDVSINAIERHFNHYNNNNHPLGHIELTFGEHYA